MVRGTNASEVLGGVGLATPQPPSFAPGDLVLLLFRGRSVVILLFLLSRSWKGIGNRQKQTHQGHNKGQLKDSHSHRTVP